MSNIEPEFVEDLIEDDDLFEECVESEGLGEDEEPTNKKKKPLVICHICSRPLFTTNGYKNHLKMHIFADLFETGPGHGSVKEECSRHAETVLKEIQSIATKMHSGLSGDIVQLVEYLLVLTHETCDIFVRTVSEAVLLCFPEKVNSISSFSSEFTVNFNKVANDLNNRKVLKEVLKEIAPVNVSETALNWFVADFFRRMALHIQAFYLRGIREPHELFLSSSTVTTGVQNDDLEDESFKQTVHYVGGSVVRSVLKVALSGSKEPWPLIVQCIQEKFLVGDLASAPPADISAWTEAQDRGGLKFISNSVWTFLMALSGLLKTLEKEDGSVLHDEVLKSVQDDDIMMFLWSEVVGDLPDIPSSILLKKICKYFVNAWGRGVTLRLKNQIPKLCRDKVPLRGSLLTKKT